jgi:phosphoglycerate kinase
MKVPSIAEKDISGKTVFIRVDFDVPLNNESQVLNETKILSVIPTIRYAIEQKAKVIIASSLGSPKGKFIKKYSLEPIGEILSSILNTEIFFPENSIGEAVRKIGVDMQPGQVMLLENLDFQIGEAANSPEFAKKLSSSADIYVNEAFSASDQIRASLNAICEFFDDVCIGFQFQKEIENLDRIRNPQRPFTAVFGGRNVLGKIEILESMLDNVDTIMVGGVFANTFLNVLGGETGKSDVDTAAIYRAKKLVSSSEIRNIRIILPQDWVTIKGNLNNYSSSFIISGGRIPNDLQVVDIGPVAQADFTKRLSTARTVLWTGPLGICEDPEFRKGTEALVGVLAQSDAFNVIVGEHTTQMALDSIGKEGGSFISRSFISHGGQTALDYIKGNKLPALMAMESRIK